MIFTSLKNESRGGIIDLTPYLSRKDKSFIYNSLQLIRAYLPESLFVSAVTFLLSPKASLVAEAQIINKMVTIHRIPG